MYLLRLLRIWMIIFMVAQSSLLLSACGKRGTLVLPPLPDSSGQENLRPATDKF